MTATPIKILHVITSLNQGGAETMLVKLCQSMDRDRFELRVVSLLSDGVLAPQLRQAGLVVDDLGMKNGRPSLSAFLKLRSLMRDFQPDLVQSWLYHADLLATSAWLMGKRQAVLAWNIRCSDMDFSRYSPVTRMVVSMLAKLSGKPAIILSNANAAIHMHQQLGYQAKEWLVLPNGFDVQRFRPNREVRARLREGWSVGEEMRLVGLPARVDPQKDHGTFLSALRGLPNVTAVLIGDGTEVGGAALDHLIAVHAPDLPLIRLGRRADMPEIYAALDLVVLSSAYGEGFPNVLGEALASAVPALATDVGDSRQILEGLTDVVPPGDAAGLRAAIAHLLQLSPEARVALGQRGRDRVTACYALPSIAKAYENLYTRLCKQQE